MAWKRRRITTKYVRERDAFRAQLGELVRRAFRSRIDIEDVHAIVAEVMLSQILSEADRQRLAAASLEADVKTTIEMDRKGIKGPKGLSAAAGSKN